MKYRLLTFIFMFFVCLTVVGQVNQVWWSKGRVLHVNPVAGIDSVTFGQFVNADTFLIVIDRASRRIVYDTIDEHVPGMVFHDTIYTTHTVYLEPGRRIGVFSVAKDRQVSFAQGNLQYVRNQDVWKFADQQYEYIGAGNVKDGELANKIDLFGWSADNTTAPFGVSTSVNNTDYLGDFVDWSVNEINIDKLNMWRTLSRDEWEYLLNERENAKTLRGRAQVAGVNGLVFLPDNWISPEGIELNLDEQATKVFTIDQWHLLENEGVVFLPAAGRRQGLGLINVNDHGNYWSTTRKNSNYAEYLAFTHSTNKLYVDAQLEINLGRSVRLVHDTIVPPPAPCKTFDVNGVEFNMMCVEGGTFTMGKGEDAHQVTLSDYYMAQSELTQVQWEAVMGKIEKGKYAIEKYGDNYPMSGISLMQCQEFVDRLNELTGLHFRISTEAEWEYAARGGVKSKGYKYAGSDDINEVAIWNGTVRLDENGKNIYAPEPVMTRKPNELGIYDMSGNIAEWVNDWNGEFNLYPQINPTGPTTYTTTYSHRVHYRGGCWTFPEYKCEVTFKQPKNVPTITDPNRGFNGIGLRLVLSDEEPFKMVYLNDSTRIFLRQVKGGTFMMGATADDAEAEADEKPQHEVTLSDYYIGQTEVTQQLWQTVMGYNPSSVKGDNLPVESVSWDECQQFVEKLSQMTGLYFRLPTEAEWEYAARGGNRSKGYTYAGSNNADSVAWHIWNTTSLQEVGQLQSNELGIYDMTGNVWEYCSDYKSPYTAEAQVNPQGPQTTSSKQRVTRGGGWRQNPGFDTSLRYCRVINRASLNKSDIVGLRIVLDERSVFDEPKPSKRIGVFSVAKDRQVSFSQGNLQYVRNQDVWKFADQQYEYIGAENVKDGELANKIDLFGWSADNTTAPFGVSTSTNAADYSGDFVDWGVNEINGEAPNTWRTLSQEEWGYIFESRKNAKQLYSKGSIDGVRGMIVLPDDWVLPEGLHFTAAPDNLTMDLDINIYTRAQWQKMEEAGAVFLCPTGRRDGLKIGYLVEYGGYWSSSRAGSNRVKHLYFNYESLIFNTNYNSGDQSYGYNGRAVRLVHDTIVPPPAPCMMVKVNDTR